MPSASAWVEWDLQSIEQRSAHAQKRSASSFGAAEFSRYIVELEAASSCNLRLLDYTRFILVIYLTNASFWWYKGGRYILEEAKNSCNHIDSSRISLINGKVKSKRHSQRKHGRIHITKSVVDFYPNFAKNSCFSFVLVIGFPDCCLSVSRYEFTISLNNFLTVWPTMTFSTLLAAY